MLQLCYKTKKGIVKRKKEAYNLIKDKKGGSKNENNN